MALHEYLRQIEAWLQREDEELVYSADVQRDDVSITAVDPAVVAESIRAMFASTRRCTFVPRSRVIFSTVENSNHWPDVRHFDIGDIEPLETSRETFLPQPWSRGDIRELS